MDIDEFEKDQKISSEICKSDEVTLKLEQQEVEAIVSKVRQKAELLIKLATPNAWSESDS